MVRSNRFTSRKPRHRNDSVSVRSWTAEDDTVLRQGVVRFGAKRWRDIAALFPGRDPVSCSTRWDELQNHGIAVKRSWSEEEDRTMTRLVEEYGDQRWAVIASHLPGRNAKQCRERWRNQLCPSINKTTWTAEEDDLIVSLQSRMGNAWAQIASQLHHRTDNAVKNRWHSKLLQSKRKGRRQPMAGWTSKPLKRTSRTTSPTSVEDVPMDNRFWCQVPVATIPVEEEGVMVLIPPGPDDFFMINDRVEEDAFPDFQLSMDVAVEPVTLGDWMTLDDLLDPLQLSALSVA